MSTYIAITDSQLDPDAPLTSQLAYQWRDNPLAMFEGAAGAPRLQFAALDAWYVTAGAVGSLAWLAQISGGGASLNAGTSYAGSGLCYSGINDVDGLNSGGSALTGSWLALGSVAGSSADKGTLFLRIA